MAINFSANQYEHAFNPRKLCNWECPKNEVRVPKRRSGATKIITNNNGHLFPRINKINPWRKTTMYPNNLPSINDSDTQNMGQNGDTLTAWEKRSSHVPIVVEQHPSVAPISLAETFDTRKSSTSDEKCEDKYIEKNIYSNSGKSNISSTPSLNSSRNLSQTKPMNQNEPILANAYCNDLVAKNLRYHNQKHQILADAIDNISSATLKNQHDEKLDTIPALGCKLFQSPGPTQCSKLKVFRPKTSPKYSTCSERSRRSSTEIRPKSAPKAKSLSEMDLAVYWDVTGPPPTSINDKTIVVDKIIQPSTNNTNQNENVENDYNEQVVNLTPHGEDDGLFEGSRKKSIDTNISMPISKSPSSSSRRSSSQSRNTNRNSMIEFNQNIRQKNDFESSSKQHKMYKSMPNLTDAAIQVNANEFKKTKRDCSACKMKFQYSKPPEINNAKTYKLAFKAGKPNALAVDAETLERMHRARHLSVPKPKIPYAKKSYSIGTLMPPFSVWPRAVGHDYPDHWRLASVYQHSFKPLETRKIPLVKTVFL